MEVHRYVVGGCGWMQNPNEPDPGMCGMPVVALWQLTDGGRTELNAVCGYHDSIIVESLKDILVRKEEE